VLVPANLNSPEQIVISGDIDSIEEALIFAFDNNLKAIPLPVSGAFHSPLMQEAAQDFANIIGNFQFNDAGIPVISNVTTKPVINGYEWSQLLEQQITSAVRWEASIRYIYERGIEVFVEVGPKKVLSKLIKKIVPSAVTLNVENVKSLQETLLQLQQVSDLQLV
jgi:[acyl-carrier-protein] S-malonyltransferase